MADYNCTVGKSWKYKEPVSGSKFRTGMFSLLNPVLWLKDVASIFNLRKIVIYLVIVGGIFGYGWYQGTLNKPINVKLGWGKEAYIRLEENRVLHIAENGMVYLEDKNGKIIRQISAKDMPGLRDKLAPFGLKLEPFVLAGGGMNSKGGYGLEGGVGVSFARFWKMNLDVLATNMGVYGGTSYNLTENSRVGIGAGVGWKDRDGRVILYYGIRF